jgi:hypothetical protein
MKKYHFVLLLFINSCNLDSKEVITVGLQPVKDCKALSSFVVNLGFTNSTTAFSTSEKKITGICLKDISVENKYYQHPTWKDKGGMGPIAIDEIGNVYVAPIPFVNVLESEKKNQNIIYKIDGKTGEMKTWLQFDNTQDTVNAQNAYGVVGLYYDCDLKLIYASNLYGSTLKKEVGNIYCIDTKISPASVIDIFKNEDAMGIGVAYFNDKKSLFFGNARNQDIYRITLKEDGTFSKDKKYCFSLAGIGKRGDDIAKKLRITPQSTLLITGTEFYFNLTAPTIPQESKYEFSFDVNSEKWISKEL